MAHFQLINGCCSMLFMSGNYDFDKFGINEQLRAAIIHDLVRTRTRLSNDIYGIAFVTNDKQNFLQRNLRNPFLGIHVMKKAYRKSEVARAYLGQISLDVPIIAEEVNYQIPLDSVPVYTANAACGVACDNVPDEAAV